MGPDLGTTNVLLGIMAAVSVLQALVLIGAGIAGFVAYRRVMQLVSDLEARQIAPLREKVETILADVKTVTTRVSEQTERVDQAIAGTIGRVDETAERVRHSVRDKVNQATGVVRGIRAVIASVLRSAGEHDNGGRPGSSADAASRL
jgi:predicted membrane metal-binding protein